MTGQDIAVFTICHSEPVRLKKWLKYYTARFAAENIYVLCHNIDDPDTLAVLPQKNQVWVYNETHFNHNWLLGVVSDFHRFLLRSHTRVIFVEVDEFLIANDQLAADSKHDLVELLLNTGSAPFFRAKGFELLHMPDEPDLDWNKPFFEQRNFWSPSNLYSKVVYSSYTPDWTIGFHTVNSGGVTNGAITVNNLYLVHTHRVDRKETKERHYRNAQREWSILDVMEGRAKQQQIIDDDEIRDFCSGRSIVTEALKPDRIDRYMTNYQNLL